MTVKEFNKSLAVFERFLTLFLVLRFPQALPVQFYVSDRLLAPVT
jgi:hypothetical protein